MLLEGCTFTALASLSEGVPNAVLESLACGRAVIASRVGGVPEILADGGGIMVPPGDSDALARALVELGTDLPLALRMGDQGRHVARERFGLERDGERKLDALS